LPQAPFLTKLAAASLSFGQFEKERALSTEKLPKGVSPCDLE
jgi:hypothetical protein